MITSIAILHYHLNPGGVTQVIARHLRALQRQAEGNGPTRAAVLFGGRREGWPDPSPDMGPLEFSVHVAPGLDYDKGKSTRPRELAAHLKEALLKAGFAGATTVIHVHNHSLGKNLSLPGALAELAREGFGLLLQIHDFAEDFRPENYRRLREQSLRGGSSDLSGSLYPQADHIHYAVLNRRDERLLLQAGVARERLHVLPNPIGDPVATPPREPARKKLAERFGLSPDCSLALYPVRGIRRKNLGEALLWSSLAGEKWRFGVTLAPLNPVERPAYDRWRSLAATLDLPMRFEMGGPSGLPYHENLAAADAMLTTSVAEGFGMVFLESWLADKMLMGRDLPEITADFVAAGLGFPYLRPRLLAPIDWIGAPAFRQALADIYLATLAAYGRPSPPATVLDHQLDGLIVDGQIDFGVLCGTHQQQIIQQAARDIRRRDRLMTLNPWIHAALQTGPGDFATVRKNAAIVRRDFSLEGCGRRLVDVYRAVASSPRTGTIQPLAGADAIVSELLRLSRFHPIRAEA